MNRRVIVKQTENDLIVVLRDFYNKELLSKIVDIIKPMGKSCKADAITIVISVNDRLEYDIIKCLEKLDID